MKIFFTKIEKIINPIHKFFRINPHRHWNALLNSFFILTALSVLFSFYFMYEIENEKIFQVKEEQVGKHVLLNENLLKKTIELFDQKAQKVSEIKNNLSPYKDPGI